jgi:hypothetical protein
MGLSLILISWDGQECKRMHTTDYGTEIGLVLWSTRMSRLPDCTASVSALMEVSLPWEQAPSPPTDKSNLTNIAIQGPSVDCLSQTKPPLPYAPIMQRQVVLLASSSESAISAW